jgi:hypothetical protein
MAPKNTRPPNKRATGPATATTQGVTPSVTSTVSQSRPDESSVVRGDRDAAQARALELGYETNVLSTSLKSEQYIFCSIEFPEPDDPTGPSFETSCLLNAPTKAIIESLKPFEEPPDSENIVPLPVEGRAHDIGLFATGPIAAGSTLISERPTVIFPSMISLDALSGDIKTLCQTLVNRLVMDDNSQLDDQASEIRKLKNSFQSASCLEEGVMRTNGLAVSFTDARVNCETYSGVFLNISRCNHRFVSFNILPARSILHNAVLIRLPSCSPNAILTWSSKTFAMSLLAVRNIGAKEEVTIAYTDILKSSFKRSKALQTMYSFKCGCSSCSALSREKKASDTRRAILQAWLDKPNHSFARWRQATDAAAETEKKVLVSEALRDLNALVECFSMDGLESLRAQHMEVVDSLARVYGALGNQAMFLKALERAIEVWNIDSDRSLVARKRVTIYESWRHEPASFPHWDQL